MSTSYDAVALFSGGLDSILAVKTLEGQGLKIKCLHFITPFFGKPDQLEHWRREYALDVEGVDVGQRFVHMLHARPEHGFGKVLNPCVDCKILMLREARARMEHYGARFVASGEVLGQRPMSQRRDTLNIIRRESGLGDALLRPLSAALLPPVAAELEGLVDRTRLHDIAGRGRAKQLRLAARFGIREIPTPAGGCRLAERENACRYWPLLQHKPQAGPEDFALANIGRQLWAVTPEGAYWLCVGRNAADNAALERQASEGDILFTLRDFPGPLGLARPLSRWSTATREDAARVLASFAPHAVRQGGAATVCLRQGTTLREVAVLPARDTALAWATPPWEEVRAAIRAEARERA